MKELLTGFHWKLLLGLSGLMTFGSPVVLASLFRLVEFSCSDG